MPEAKLIVITKKCEKKGQHHKLRDSEDGAMSGLPIPIYLLQALI